MAKSSFVEGSPGPGRTSGRTGLFHSDWKQIPQVQRPQVWLLCEHRHVLDPHPRDPHLVLAAQTLPRALTGEETEVG